MRLRDETGTFLVETALILSLVVVVAVLILAAIGTNVVDALTTIADQL